MKSLLALFFLAFAAQAADIHTANGIAIKGHDPVAYFVDGKPSRRCDDLRVEYAGATYVFANTANRDAFAANPSRYLPQYGGYCAFGG